MQQIPEPLVQPDLLELEAQQVRQEQEDSWVLVVLRAQLVELVLLAQPVQLDLRVLEDQRVYKVFLVPHPIQDLQVQQVLLGQGGRLVIQVQQVMELQEQRVIQDHPVQQVQQDL